MPTTYQPTPKTKQTHEASSAKRLKTLAAKPEPRPIREDVALPFDSTMLPDEVFDLRVPPADQRWAVIARRIASL